MPPPADEVARTVSLLIFLPGDSAHPQPVTVGLPFPRGALADGTALSVIAADGRAFVTQSRCLARWPDGSVRWLLVGFLLPPLPAGKHRWTMQPQASAGVESPSADEGIVQFNALGSAFPIHSVKRSGANLIEPDSMRLLLTDPRGNAKAVLAGIHAEEFPGTGLVRLRITIRNSRAARHRGGLWDLGDAGSMLFRDLSLFLDLASNPLAVRWTAEAGQEPRALSSGSLEIYQDSSGGANWQSVNHVNSAGRVPLAFRGYRVRAEGREETGLRASPVVSVRTAAGTVTLALREFWQQFPKAIEVEGRSLTVRLFPKQFGDLHELQGGEQKTHEVWLHFGAPTISAELPLSWVHAPARVVASPEWYASCGVVPFLSVAGSEPLDALLAKVIDGPESFVGKREVIDEYGWRHFGELYADHENAYARGPKPVISHYNNQYDVLYGLIFQYLRTADPRWWNLLDPLARHVIDIDLYHTDQDRAAYNGGLFWHTTHYHSAGTATHRAYSKLNVEPGRPYGGGPGNEHNYTTGLLLYYYLTGDEQARDAVRSLADWVIASDDGRRTILRIVDPGPTGLASATYSEDYHGPGRGAGNSVNALLDGWLLTGSRPYLDKAEELIRRVIHPADDLAARELLNIEARWSYTVFLSVLFRYLTLKAEHNGRDAMYAYGRASLLHYAAWMADNERPYFDRPNELEFPTETWAAQELRKANVMRLAARHAEGALREKLLQRGEELAARAWTDFGGFASQTCTRPVALMLQEGPRDTWLRQHSEEIKRPPEGQPSFGEPERFVPQKLRVKGMLRSPSGLLRVLLGLLNPRNWRG